jgi:hypothetical protein
VNDYVAGSTSVVEIVDILDNSSTTGGGKTALAYNTSGLTCYYKRSNGTASVSVTLANIITLGTFVSGGFKEIDATNQPGAYEFHPPDAAFASGAKWVTFYLQGASGMVRRAIKVRILAVNPDSAATFMTGVNGIGPPSNWNAMAISVAGAVTVGTLAAAAIQSIWDALTSALGTNGSIGKWIVEKLDIAVSTRGTGDATAANQSTINANLLAIPAAITSDHGTGSYIRNTEPDNATIASIASALATLAGKFTGITALKNWLGAIAGKTADATTRAEINATAAGATFNETTDSEEAIRDALDAGVSGGFTSTDRTTLAAIKSQTDLITTGQILVISAFASGTLTIKRGDSYSSAAGQTIVIAKPSGASWPSLIGQAITFTANVLADYVPDADGADTTFTAAGTVLDSTTLRIDITHAATSNLMVGAGIWEFDIQASLGDERNTLLLGSMSVVADQTQT